MKSDLTNDQCYGRLLEYFFSSSTSFTSSSLYKHINNFYIVMCEKYNIIMLWVGDMMLENMSVRCVYTD